MTVLEEVLADLKAEGDRVQSWIEPLDDQLWREPTPAPGWDIATTVAHLAWTDEVVALAAGARSRWQEFVLRAMQDPEGFVDAEAIAGARSPSMDILQRWTAARSLVPRILLEYPEGEKLPWFGPPMSPTSMATARFMETWAHGLDIADTLGIEVEPTERIRHIAHLGVRTRNFSFASRGLEVPLEDFHVCLQSPSGESWEWGTAASAQAITGSANDFALLVTQRRHRNDLDLVAVGVEADKWLDIAQAFAGPTGKGRAPLGETTSDGTDSGDPR